MAIKMYISSTCGNKEMKKHQVKSQLILESKGISCEILDIADPVLEDNKKFMQQNAKPRTGKYPLPPQFFNEDVWCGDYESFDEANETDTLEEFLRLPIGSLNKNILKATPNGLSRPEETAVTEPVVANGNGRLSEEKEVAQEEERVSPVREMSVEPAAEKIETVEVIEDHPEAKPVEEESEEEESEEEEDVSDEDE